MESVHAVRARIAAIQGSFGARGVQALPATPATGFAAALAKAEAPSGASPDRAKWAADLLDRLQIPKTPENVRAMTAWAQAEGTKASFNPLATTQGASGATNFNSVGVKNYPSYEVGLEATVKTLLNGRYENILGALRRGNSAEAVGSAIEDSPWGTGGLVLRVLRGG
ncbi:MAG: hypothetical protein ACOYN3_05510 [Acidimicrobiia bacterium]